jgi:hypothetical protein
MANIDLRTAIDLASNQNREVWAIVSMLDAHGLGLYGTAVPTFRPDVPLLNPAPFWLCRLSTRPTQSH